MDWSRHAAAASVVGGREGRGGCREPGARRGGTTGASAPPGAPQSALRLAASSSASAPCFRISRSRKIVNPSLLDDGHPDVGLVQMAFYKVAEGAPRVLEIIATLNIYTIIVGLPPMASRNNNMKKRKNIDLARVKITYAIPKFLTKFLTIPILRIMGSIFVHGSTRELERSLSES
jgi:hypothetical protein